MRLLLISDTHIPRRARDLPAPVWDQVERADVVIHAGDWVDVALLDELGIKAGLLINGSRTVASGVSVGPPLFDLLEILGQDTVVARLSGALTFGKH